MNKLINKLMMDAIKDPTEENFAKLQNALESQQVEDEQNSLKTDKALTQKSKYSEEAVSFATSLKEAIALGANYTGLVPKDVAQKVEMKMGEYGVLRKYCTVHNMGGSFSFAAEDGAATATWVAEAGLVTETTPTLAPVSLTAKSLAALVKVSKEAANDIDFMLDFIIEALGKGFAHALDVAIIKGAGVVEGAIPQPYGIVTKLKAQANTPQIVTGTAGTTSTIGFTWADLKKTITKVGAHRKGAVVICNQTTLDHIYEFKDAGKYIFDQNQPLEKIWGLPVVVVEDMDDAYTQASSGSDAYPVIIANLGYYHIGMRQDLEIQTLKEAFAINRQVGILADQRFDGNFGNYNAFAAMKIAKAS